MYDLKKASRKSKTATPELELHTTVDETCFIIL